MIENMLCLDSSIILEEIDAVHDKRLKVCLDIGHAHGNSDMPVYDWIKTLNKRIGYMHMHNNHGKITFSSFPLKFLLHSFLSLLHINHTFLPPFNVSFIDHTLNIASLLFTFTSTTNIV